MLPVTFGAAGEDISAYVLGMGGVPRSIVIVNKLLHRRVRVRSASLKLPGGSIMRLAGQAIDSGDAITLGGAAVDAEGACRSVETGFDGQELSVEAASAVILFPGKQRGGAMSRPDAS